MPEAEQQVSPPLTNQWFVTTHWSVVQAAKDDDLSKAAAALETL